jgi:hypothetical protein
MAHDPTESGATAPDNARQMIETASAFAQREMLPEARQALQRARTALAQRSDVGPAHWCNACLVALEIAARGGDAQGMEAEAAQLRSLSGGGQYWSEQARARIARSHGRVDPSRLDRVYAVLAGEAAPAHPAPEPPPPAPTRPEGMARGIIAPTPRPPADPAPSPRAEPAEPPAPPAASAPAAPPAASAGTPPAAPADTRPAPPVPRAEPEPAPAPWHGLAPPRAEFSVPPRAELPAPAESAPPRTAPEPSPPRAEADPAPPASAPPPAATPAPERAYLGAAWGGAPWGDTDRLPAESISASPDPAFYVPEEADDGWMDRLAELAEVGDDDDLPLIFVHDDAGPVDARLRVAPDRTDAEELLRSFVDHMTRWRDDVSDEEAENFYDLGTSFLDMEQWESAVKVFDQAMRNAATRVAAAEGYLKALIGMGDHHAAFGAAGMALSNLAGAGEPLSGILFLRGRAAEEIGDPREARRCYQEALRIDRFYADARERLAALEG